MVEGPSTRAYGGLIRVWVDGMKRRETNALVVNYLDDGGKASHELAVGEEDDAAHFDKAPLGGRDFDFCHGCYKNTISAYGIFS